MADHHDNFDETEALFREARNARPAVSERLVSAILADAAAQQAQWQVPAITLPITSQDGTDRRGPVAALVSALGGWVSVGGLVAASCTGLWIGIAGPEVVMTATGLGAFGDASAMVSGDDYAAYETFDLATVLAEDMQ